MSEQLDRLRDALAERYIVERPVGRGGMATVYLARDRKHDRAVAIKVLREELASSLGAERFLREIEIAARLSHPHILPLHDSGQAATFLFYVMPFVDGPSLRDRLRQERQLGIDDALETITAIAAGLDYAHRQGVIHRDLKPDNIMFHAGEPMLADFGIARAINVAGAERLTETGLSLGTPAYMSPEQASGEGHLDERSDIYSLGCMLYEMLVGQPPFVGPNAQAVMARHVTDPVPPLTTVRPSVADAVARAVERALAKVPADRYGTPTEFVEALTSGEAGHASTNEQVLLVLPFGDLGPDVDGAYFADGLTDELITRLSEIRKLQVPSLTSVMQLKGQAVDLRALSREWRARYVLEGSVRRDGGSVRVTARLRDASRDAQIWADRYRDALDDPLAVQEQIATAIVAAIRPALGVGDAPSPARTGPNMHAYESYLRARRQMWRFTEPAVIHALQSLQETLDIVGEDVLVYAGIAEAYFLFPHLAGREPEACMQRVAECADRIFDLDAESAYGHWLMGLVHSKEPDGVLKALTHLQRASRLDSRAPSIAFWSAYFAAVAGQMSHAAGATEQLATLDPLSPLTRASHGWLHLMRGDPEAALDAYAVAVESDRENPYLGFLYASCLARNGRVDDASRVVEGLSKAAPGSVCTWLGKVYRFAIREERSRAIRAVTPELKQAARWCEAYSFFLAECLALIGERTQALEWLENATRRGFINYPLLCNATPYLDSLRSEERFQALLGRVQRAWRRGSPT